MPIERKIMLSILLAVLTIFSGYLLYTEIYKPYRSNIKQIKRLEDYITKFEKKKNREDLTALTSILEKSQELNKLFFDTDNFSLDDFASETKETLISNNVTINQFRTVENAITFNIKGSRGSVLSAIFELSRSKPLYDFTTLQLRVDKNRSIQGVITLSPLFYPIEADKKNIRETSKTLDLTESYNYHLEDIFGEAVIVETDTEPELQREIVKTDKFSYIGTVKKGEEKTYMFRETTNGRVFIFSLGETISQWKLDEIKENGFIFTYEDKLYEVNE